jgi:outer membrane protein assembly factor BamB
MTMKTKPHMFALLVLACSMVSAPGQQDTWTRFRGPNGSGISDARTIPMKWTAKDYNWTVKLPGAGSSSPVVWGNRIFLTCNDAQPAVRRIVCLDTRDGRVRWFRDYVHPRYAMHRDNDFASATPSVDADGVVLTWSTPGRLVMLALDLEGREQWRKDLGPYVGLHGSASSPVIVDDLVILANDQMNPVVMKRHLPKNASMTPGDSFLIAVDRATGDTRWKLKRRTVLAGYATPCLRRPEGGDAELVFTGTAHGITGVDLATGKVNWEIPGLFSSRTVGSPQLHGDLVFASHGAGLSGQRFVAVRARYRGGTVKPALAYEVTRSVPLVPSCLVKDGLLFLWTGGGIVTCLDAATGREHWRERVGGSYYCSPVWVDGRLYCISKEGDVVIIAADKVYRFLAKVPLGEKCFSVPAIAGGVMYLRTQSQLFSLGGAPEKK